MDFEQINRLAFILLIQTRLILHEPKVSADDAAAALVTAMRINGKYIPTDVGAAAKQYVDWFLRRGSHKAPAWVQTDVIGPGIA